MELIELIELSRAQRLDVYNNHLTKDFHASEVKPLEKIEYLVEKGYYIGFGFYEGDIFLGYAFLTKTDRGNIVLMDYLAVCSGLRSKGLGTRFIKTLNEKLRGRYLSLIAEVEDLDFATDEKDKANRERRISFYLQNGFEVSNVQTRVLTDDYRIIKLGLDRELTDDEISSEMDEIYKISFGEEYFEKNIKVEIKK